jgi:hypothetical protein
MTSGYFDPYGGVSPGPLLHSGSPFLVVALSEASVRWPLVTTVVAVVSGIRMMLAAAWWNPGPRLAPGPSRARRRRRSRLQDALSNEVNAPYCDPGKTLPLPRDCQLGVAPRVVEQDRCAFCDQVPRDDHGREA